MGMVGMPQFGVIHLRMETTPPRLTVNHGEQGVTVDSSAPRSEMGIPGWFELLAQEKAQSQNYCEKGIAKIVSEGDAMARIQDGGNPIADFAASRLTEYYEDHQVVLGAIPRTPPDITVRYSPTSFRFEPGNLTINYGNRLTGLDIIV
jgi:hypothetical protein